MSLEFNFNVCVQLPYFPMIDKVGNLLQDEIVFWRISIFDQIGEFVFSHTKVQLCGSVVLDLKRHKKRLGTPKPNS